MKIIARRYTRHHSVGTKLNQIGDTIIEVLVALAIISLVLVGAYVVSSNSERAVRDSQEHAEASKLLQGQIELIKGLAKSGTVNVFNSTYIFCVLQDGSDVSTSITTDATGRPAPTADTYSPNLYAPGCKSVGPSKLYNIAISYNGSTHDFYLTARWDRIGGGVNQVDLTYRAYTSS